MGQSLVADIIACCVVISALGLVFTGLRLWSGFVAIGRFAIDDYVAIASALLLVFHSTCVGYTTRYGAGVHTADLSPELRMAAANAPFPANMVMLILNTWTQAALKSNILLFYVRVSGVHTWFKRSSYGLLAVCVAMAIGTTPAITMACTPVQAQFWPTRYPGADCSRATPTYITAAFLHCATDVMIVLLPIPLMFHSHLPSTKKLEVAFLFMIGGLAVAGGAMKIYYSLLLRGPDADRNWIAGKSMIWAEIEIGMGVVASCLPAVRALVQRLQHRIGYFTGASTDGGNSRLGTRMKSTNKIYAGPNTPKHIYNVQVERQLRNASAVTEEEGMIFKQSEFKMEFDNRSRDSK